MKEKICFLFAFLMLFCNVAFVEASKISEKETHVVTVTAEVPAGYNRDITLLYKEAGIDGWNYEFKLTSVNGYTVSQRLEEGEYQCIERTAQDTVLSSEEVLSLYHDAELLVSVVDKRSSEGITQTEAVPIATPTVRSYGWVKPAIIVTVVLGILIAVVVVVKK